MIFAPAENRVEVSALIDLWMEAFGEEKEAVLPFFRDIFPLCQAWCATENGTLCAMAYALPHTVVVGEKRLPAAYLYAVATKKEYRGQGLATLLLGEMEKSLKSEGRAGLLLVPANKGLFAFYEKLGMKPFSGRVWQELSAEEGEIFSCSAEEYLQIRETYLKDLPHNVPPAAVAARYGLYRWENGCCAVEKTEEDVVFRELLGERRGACAVLRFLGAEKGIAHLPTGDIPYAVAKPLCADFPKEGYFAFAME